MATFDYIPAPNASKRMQPKVLKSSFGDGYEQRIPDGINTKRRVWNLTFNRVTSIIDEIENFFIARNAVESFDWTPPQGDSGKFVCEEWARDIPVLNTQSINATFVEVFE